MSSISSPEPSCHGVTGSSRMASIHKAMWSASAGSRSSDLRACSTMRPAVLTIRKHRGLDRAHNNSAGNPIRFNAVSTLCAIAASRSQAAFHPGIGAEVLARHKAAGQLALQHIVHGLDRPRLLPMPRDQQLRMPHATVVRTLPRVS